MFTIRIAELNIAIDNRYDHAKRFCKDYIVDSSDIDFSVSVNDDDIAFEREHSEFVYTDDIFETVAIYRKISKILPEYDALLFHSAVISLDGKAYAFAAKSGVGKSTHIRLWQEHFGDKITIINGDKPIFRMIDGEFFAFGTPWCGKEGLQTNTSEKLSSICFLERVAENTIERLDTKQVIGRIYNQLILPQEREAVEKTFDLLNLLIMQTPCYLLHCNISDDAVECAYNGMNE